MNYNAICMPYDQAWEDIPALHLSPGN